MQEIIKIFCLLSYVLNSSSYHLSETLFEKIFVEKKATIQELNALAQRHFLRPKHAERMSKEAIQHYKKLYSRLSIEQKKEIIKYFYDLGYITSVYPKRNVCPDIILIQGSTVPDMRERLMFLAKNIENGIIFFKPETQIVFLVGERTLFLTETKEVLLNTSPYLKDPHWNIPKILPLDEREASKLIWDQLQLPSSLREKKPIFIEATKQQNSTRAQTMDCVQLWLQKTTPQAHKKVLMISNNPYIHYQKDVTDLEISKAGFNNFFDIEGIGRSFDLDNQNIDITIGILMDTLARVLYVENQRQEMLSKTKSDT
ncbi:MAG: hypothetical protein J0H12_06045 [Candidatus Paracaedimonas acanthamoebae]|uniref:Uncharacterized protein n=1 Tax=Candidatus Paracaedimonas acanthamoebae TaxID=244581 RepID=A0A8J7PJS2_9PROT|nr:hypothetical protein [Candidatus Paracaedimonas acanthamoebae]